MSFNTSIEAPDFERIRRGDARATEDGIRLLWTVLEDESRTRRTGVRQAVDRFQKKVLISSPTAGENNFAYQQAAILRFDGASNVTLTGLRAGVEGELVLVSVLGAGTITLAHESASSEALNRFYMQSGADTAIATNRAMLLAYLNARWREQKWV